MSRLHRHLRLGLLHEGRLVRELLIDRATDVTLGRLPGATLDVHTDPDAPLRQDVLLYERGWFLVVPDRAPQADGHPPESVVSLRGVTGLPAPVSLRGQRCVPIDPAFGGSVQWGAWTVLFQFVGAGVPVTVTRDQPVLRVGLVLGDRLLTERAFMVPGEITVGPSARATLVLPAEEYAGPPVSLQRRRDGSVLLRVDAAADLVLAAGDQPMDTTALVQAGHARRTGRDLELTLGLGARGRVHLGPYTVLLQVVLGQMAVAVPPRRGPLQQVARLFGTDRTWAASLLAAALFVGLVVGQAIYQQRTVGRFLGPAQADELPTGPIEIELPTPPEPDKPTPVAQLQPPIEPAKAEPTRATQPKPLADKPVAKRQEIDTEPRKTVREVVAQQTIAGVFDKLQGTSAMFAPDEKGDVVARRAFGSGFAAETEAHGPGTSALVLPRARVDRGPEALVGARTSLGPRVAEVAKVTAKKQEETVHPKPLDPLDPDTPTDDSAAVARVMARKNAAVRRCYETALREDADLDGKVAIRFVVGAAGTVIDAEVSGATGSFADCIRAVFENARGLPPLAKPRAFRQSYVFSKGG